MHVSYCTFVEGINELHVINFTDITILISMIYIIIIVFHQYNSLQVTHVSIRGLTIKFANCHLVLVVAAEDINLSMVW
jgi:hypothetical protein